MVTTSPHHPEVTGPVMPLGTSEVAVHAIIDHEILETIVNNRTAMVTYHKNIRATDTAVGLFGPDGVKASIVSWSLDAANSMSPQP